MCAVCSTYVPFFVNQKSFQQTFHFKQRHSSKMRTNPRPLSPRKFFECRKSIYKTSFLLVQSTMNGNNERCLQIDDGGGEVDSPRSVCALLAIGLATTVTTTTTIGITRPEREQLECICNSMEARQSFRDFGHAARTRAKTSDEKEIGNNPISRLMAYIRNEKKKSVGCAWGRFEYKNGCR